jgi:hypothetical protein
MKNLKNILIISALVLTPLFGFTQFGEELDIIVSPSSPGANENISLTVISSAPGLNNSSITWSKNGIKEKSGIGQVEYVTQVGNLGKSTVVTVSITKSSGAFLQKTIDIRPANVSLIWEADSYTPPFYKGKGLASHQSNVRVIAIPELLNSSGIKFSSENLNYEWSFNGKIDRNKSGLGKDVYEFKGSLISRPKTVGVLVSTSGGSITARNGVSISFVDPEILIYKENPLTGIKSSASLEKGFVSGNESTFIAEPYFFPEKLFTENSLIYKWVVDGVELTNSEKRRRVTFSGDVSGESSVSVKISNSSSLLQRASRLFKVIVENESRQ